jgi:hypothetical protein
MRIDAEDETIAFILEKTFVLAASWFVCRWCVHQFYSGVMVARSSMGLVAFPVLMSACGVPVDLDILSRCLSRYYALRNV